MRTIKGYKTEEVRVCIEATGPYSQAIAHCLYSKGYDVSVINPRKIKAFKDSKLARNKTDSYDALAIAEFGRMHNPVLWHTKSYSPPRVKGITSVFRAA